MWFGYAFPFLDVIWKALGHVSAMSLLLIRFGQVGSIRVQALGLGFFREVQKLRFFQVADSVAVGALESFSHNPQGWLHNVKRET